MDYIFYVSCPIETLKCIQEGGGVEKKQKIKICNHMFSRQQKQHSSSCTLHERSKNVGSSLLRSQSPLIQYYNGHKNTKPRQAPASNPL